MAILKSRFGKDGIVFSNIIFNNASIQIEMVDGIGGRTKTEYKTDMLAESQGRINDFFESKKLRESLLGNESTE